MENGTTTKVTRKQLGEIYPLVCEDWQCKIDEVLLQNPFNDIMEVDNELLLKAYQAGSNEYHINWLDKVTGGINSLKPQVELGKWYWVKAQIGHKQDALIYVRDLSKKCEGNYGFNHAGEWLDGISEDIGGTGSYSIWNNLDYLKPATEAEVLGALKKEAFRRGLVPGVKIKSEWVGDSLSNDYSLILNSIWNTCEIYTYRLMSDGVWVTPVEQKQVWLKTKRKGEIVIERHPENQLGNLLLNGWEKLILSDLEQIKNEL